MTHEEAIAIIRKEYLCVDRDCDIDRSCGKCDLMMPTKEPILKAYEMAIQALSQEPISLNDINNALEASFRNGVRSAKAEQEPCDDAVSREKVMDIISDYYNVHDTTAHEEEIMENMMERVEQLPSVTQKFGKWISVRERLPEEYGEYLITWKNPKYPKTYIGICECEITDVYDHEHNRFEVEWLFDGYIATAYPDSKVIAWMPLPEPYKAESEE